MLEAGHALVGSSSIDHCFWGTTGGKQITQGIRCWMTQIAMKSLHDSKGILPMFHVELRQVSKWLAHVLIIHSVRPFPGVRSFGNHQGCCKCRGETGLVVLEVRRSRTEASCMAFQWTMLMVMRTLQREGLSDGFLRSLKPGALLYWLPNAIDIQTHSSITALVEADCEAR